MVKIEMKDKGTFLEKIASKQLTMTTYPGGSTFHRSYPDTAYSGDSTSSHFTTMNYRTQCNA